MSQVTQPRISLPTPLRSARVVVVSALLALAAIAAVALVLALGGTSQDTARAVHAAPSLRSDGGPEESGVAASIASRPQTGPNESAVAASIGAGARPAQGPDESVTAAAIAPR